MLVWLLAFSRGCSPRLRCCSGCWRWTHWWLSWSFEWCWRWSLKEFLICFDSSGTWFWCPWSWLVVKTWFWLNPDLDPLTWLDDDTVSWLSLNSWYWQYDLSLRQTVIPLSLLNTLFEHLTSRSAAVPTPFCRVGLNPDSSIVKSKEAELLFFDLVEVKWFELQLPLYFFFHVTFANVLMVFKWFFYLSFSLNFLTLES